MPTRSFPHHKLSKGNTKAFTLTEIAIVLGIIGLVLASIWIASTVVNRNIRINNASRQLIQVVENIENLTNGHTMQGLGITDYTSTYWKLGAFPNDMVLDGGSYPVTPWEGDLVIYQDPNFRDSTGRIYPNAIRVSYYTPRHSGGGGSSIPEADCIAFMMNIDSSTDLNNLQILWIFTQWSARSFYPPSNPNAPRVTVNQAQNLCAGGVQDLEFEFGLY